MTEFGLVGLINWEKCLTKHVISYLSNLENMQNSRPSTLQYTTILAEFLLLSEEKIFEKVYDVRRTPSDENISHGTLLLLFPEFEFETHQNSNHFGVLWQF
jgi:hypothetical protein